MSMGVLVSHLHKQNLSLHVRRHILIVIVILLVREDTVLYKIVEKSG